VTDIHTRCDRLLEVIGELEELTMRALPWDTGSREENQPLDYQPFARTFTPRNMFVKLSADRELISEIRKWRHHYEHDDTWYSCAQSIDPELPDGKPGSGCDNELRAGLPCDCGLEMRQLVVLCTIAAGYAIHKKGNSWDEK
jgi:hypothetical protein